MKTVALFASATLLAIAPWLLLELMGARSHVAVITGEPGNLVLGLGWMAAWIPAVALGPPLAVGTLASLLARLSARRGA